MRQTYSDQPYTYVQHARRWEAEAMQEIVREENAFQAQEFRPEETDAVKPEFRRIIRNNSGWAVEVTLYHVDGESHEYEQFIRCRKCHDITLLSGGCTFCSGCGELLEDNN